MTNQPLARDDHRYQPEDQFAQNPGPGLVAPDVVSTAESVSQTEMSIENNPTPATSAPETRSDVFAAIPKTISEEILLEWDAPSRPHKKRHRQYYTTIAVILILIGLILFFAGQFLPIAVLVAIGFLVYVLEMVPPTMVRHQLSTYGFRVEGTLYYWDEIGRFWFTERHNSPLLHLEISRFPNRLTLLIGDLPQDAMTKVLAEILINEKPPLTPLEKAGAWLERMIPLEPANPKL